jgi:hypothetical protein
MTAPPSPADPIKGLRAWQRFHLRITMLFATVVFVVITLAAVVSYTVASRQAREGLARQMEAVASTYADGIDPRALRDADPRLDDPLRKELRDWFARTHDERVASTYVLVYDDDPSQLHFFTDWARDQENAEPGEIYDATGMTEMQQGFRATVH